MVERRWTRPDPPRLLTRRRRRRRTSWVRRGMAPRVPPGPPWTLRFVWPSIHILELAELQPKFAEISTEGRLVVRRGPPLERVSTDPAAYSTLREALQGASPCQGSRGILPVRGGGRGSEAAREADARSGNGGRPRIEGGRRRPQTAAKEGRCAPGRFGSQYAVYVDIKTL